MSSSISVSLLLEMESYLLSLQASSLSFLYICGIVLDKYKLTVYKMLASSLAFWFRSQIFVISEARISALWRFRALQVVVTEKIRKTRYCHYFRLEQLRKLSFHTALVARMFMNYNLNCKRFSYELEARAKTQWAKTFMDVLIFVLRLIRTIKLVEIKQPPVTYR